MTQSYGKLGRRRNSGAWQWMIIGFIPGLLCGGVLLLALFLSGVVQNIGANTGPTDEPPTQVVLVVTATTDPDAPTITPFIITATPEPTTEAPIVEVQAASPTPSTEIVPPDAATDTTDTTGPSSPEDVEAQVAPQVTLPTPNIPSQPEIPAVLQGVISNVVTIPGGIFQMGTTPTEVLLAVEECVNRDAGVCLPEYGQDASPQVQVSLPAFQIEVTEVTFSQYVVFLNYLRSQGRNHLTGCEGFLCIQTVNEAPQSAVITFDNANYNAPPGLVSHPVYAVTWYGAKAYCETIGRRLPTEAEWERAARGDDGRVYPWGNQWNPANAKTRIPRDAPPGTVPVGTYPGGTSPFGVLDMAGNVAEWVNDWYQEDYYNQLFNGPQPVERPQGPPIALQKVLRGGSWDGLPFFARTVHRQSFFPAPDRNSDDFPRWIGFRCAQDAPLNVGTAATGIDPATLGTTGTTTQGNAQSNAQPTIPAPPEAAPTTEGNTSDRG